MTRGESKGFRRLRTNREWILGERDRAAARMTARIACDLGDTFGHRPYRRPRGHRPYRLRKGDRPTRNLSMPLPHHRRCRTRYSYRHRDLEHRRSWPCRHAFVPPGPPRRRTPRPLQAAGRQSEGGIAAVVSWVGSVAINHGRIKANFRLDPEVYYRVYAVRNRWRY